MADVLNQMKISSEEEPLGSNEQTVAKKALCYLSQIIEKNAMFDCKLFLPSVSFLEEYLIRMKHFSDSLYVDDTRLEKRLKQFLHETFIPVIEQFTSVC